MPPYPMSFCQHIHREILAVNSLFFRWNCALPPYFGWKGPQGFQRVFQAVAQKHRHIHCVHAAAAVLQGHPALDRNIFLPGLGQIVFQYVVYNRVAAEALFLQPVINRIVVSRGISPSVSG